MKTFPRAEFGDPILRRRAKPVPHALLAKPGFQKFLKQMFFTMHRADGVGLAAPQIGLPLRLAVIEVGPRRANGKWQRAQQKTKNTKRKTRNNKIVLINPEIIHASKEKSYDWEGCLSLVGVRGRVPRPRKITVQYVDERGMKNVRTISGFLARVFQHEIDHLNGSLFVDRMEDMKTLMTVGEMQKRLAK